MEELVYRINTRACAFYFFMGDKFVDVDDMLFGSAFRLHAPEFPNQFDSSHSTKVTQFTKKG